MPDWIVHISIALLLAVILKIKNWKLIITGAVLPDIPRILLIISNYLNFNELNSFLILEPLHSPFLNIFESMAIALLFANFNLLKAPFVALKGKEIFVESAEPFPLQAAGEFLGYTSWVKVKVARKQKVLMV